MINCYIEAAQESIPNLQIDVRKMLDDYTLA